MAKDEPGVTLIDGGGGFGIPAIRLAADMTLRKIENQPSAVAAVVNCGHTGRIGAYAETIARGAASRSCSAAAATSGSTAWCPTAAGRGS